MQVYDNTVKNILITILFILVVYLLYILQMIFVPLFMALLIALMFQPIITFLSKIKTPSWLILPTISIITLAIAFGIYFIISEIIDDLIVNQDFILRRLNLKMDSSLRWINEITGIRFNANKDFDGIFRMFSKEHFAKYAGRFANSLGSFTTSFATFSLYYVVLLSGMSNYKSYISYVSGNEDSKLLENFEKIQKSIYSYMIIKTILSLFMAIIVYFICYSFEINFPFLWAFLTFLLNYIPSVGSIIATLAPTLMAFVQFEETNKVILILLSITMVHFVIGNVLDPIIMGDRLKLNTLTVIFSLVFWGFLWGIPGMILSVPIMVLIKLIFEQIPSLHIIARILGKTIKV